MAKCSMGLQLLRRSMKDKACIYNIPYLYKMGQILGGTVQSEREAGFSFSTFIVSIFFGVSHKIQK